MTLPVPTGEQITIYDKDQFSFKANMLPIQHAKIVTISGAKPFHIEEKPGHEPKRKPG
jgi:hypothetical protein